MDSAVILCHNNTLPPYIYFWQSIVFIGGRQTIDKPFSCLKYQGKVSGKVRQSIRAKYQGKVFYRGGAMELFEGDRRQHRILSLACFMRCWGVSLEAIIAAIVVENKTRSQPSLPEGEVMDILDQSRLYPPLVENGPKPYWKTAS